MPQPRPDDSAVPAARQRTARLRDDAVLRAHRLAERFDWLPAGFGEAAGVDAADARAVAAEWRRCLHVWADASPEAVFGIKIGAALLGVAVAGLWIAVGLIG
jgi:hypothetical protein